MRNKITDLNNHLFAQLERLSEEDLTDEQLNKEIARSKAMTSVADSLIESAKVTVDAMKIMQRDGADVSKIGQGIFHELKEG